MNNLTAKFKNNIQTASTIFIFISMIVFLSFASDVFSTPANLLNILRQVSVTLIIAAASTFVMIAGGLDLSVGSVVAFTGVVFSKLVSDGMGLVPAIFIGILAGGIIGAANGIVVTKTKIPPVIATLGSMYVARGLAYIVSDGRAIVNNLPDSFGFANDINILGLPLIVIFTILFVGICWVMLNKTLFGKYTYAVGGNIETAKLSGINVNKTLFWVYTLVGVASGLGGVLLASRLYSGNPNVGNGLEFSVIVAIVVGGTSLTGGVGRISGTIIGALIVVILSNGMNLLGISSFYQYVVQGLVLVGAVILDQYLKSRN